MNILVTGANGQLGQQFKNNTTESDFEFYFADENELDITNKNDILNYISDYKINYILNCAAYTDVNGSESNKDLAIKINSEGIKNLVEICEEQKLKMIHLSTDYVYDSNNINPIKEDSNINPLNYYGFSKREGEKIIEKSLSDSIIIRTSWLYSMYGNNFVKTMIKKGDNGEKIYVINDQFGCPTYAKDLVNVILSIIDSGLKPKYKVYNFSNEGYTNWYDFTKKIFELKKLNCSIIPVNSENYRSIARRPKYSVLDKSRIKDTFNINIRNWEDALQEFITNIK